MFWPLLRLNSKLVVLCFLTWEWGGHLTETGEGVGAYFKKLTFKRVGLKIELLRYCDS